MSRKQNSKLPAKYQEWVDARKRHRLSHAHIQMARELGFLPKSLRKIDDHQHKPWKAPLSVHLEDLYFKRFKRERPETVTTIEEMAKRSQQKKSERKDVNGATSEQTSKEGVPGPEASTEAHESGGDI
jgi:hypothetical protein